MHDRRPKSDVDIKILRNPPPIKKRSPSSLFSCGETATEGEGDCRSLHQHVMALKREGMQFLGGSCFFGGGGSLWMGGGSLIDFLMLLGFEPSSPVLKLVLPPNHFYDGFKNLSYLTCISACYTNSIQPMMNSITKREELYLLFFKTIVHLCQVLLYRFFKLLVLISDQSYRLAINHDHNTSQA